MPDLVENKLLAGSILSSLGGFVILVYGTYEWYLGATVGSLGSLAGFPVGGPSAIVAGGIAGIIAGVCIVILAWGAMVHPESHVSYGTGVLLLGVVSLVSMGGGGGVGFLLVVLGGTALIVYRPAPAPFPSTSQARNPYEPTKTPENYFYTCKSCGRHLPADSDTCEHCGAKVLNPST